MSKRNRSLNASRRHSSPISDRVFVPGAHTVGDRVTIEGGDARKLTTVLRRRTGDQIEVIDSVARRFSAKLHVEKHFVSAILCEQLQVHYDDSALAVTVAQAVPKGQKMDFVVEKLTELGVHEIVPFLSERTIPQAPSGARNTRWQRLAAAAAQQSGRSEIPDVVAVEDFGAVLERCAAFDRVLLLWELAEPRRLRDQLPELLRGARSILVIVGPEGGFSSVEAEDAQNRGAHVLSLGTRIVRTETAALVLLAILNYLV